MNKLENCCTCNHKQESIANTFTCEFVNDSLKYYTVAKKLANNEKCPYYEIQVIK